MNLLKETLEKLKENNKTEKDILFVSDGSRWQTWNLCKKYIDIEYHSGYGGEEINKELIIVGDNWWLERHEYDGSEWWEFKILPKKPSEKTKLKLELNNT